MNPPPKQLELRDKTKPTDILSVDTMHDLCGFMVRQDGRSYGPNIILEPQDAYLLGCFLASYYAPQFAEGDKLNAADSA